MIVLNCDRLLWIERVLVLAGEMSSRSNSQKELWDRKAVWLELLIELLCWWEPVNPPTEKRIRHPQRNELDTHRERKRIRHPQKRITKDERQENELDTHNFFRCRTFASTSSKESYRLCSLVMIVLNCDSLLRIQRVQVLSGKMPSRSDTQRELWDREAVWLELLIELLCWWEPVNPPTVSSTRKLLELTYSPQRSAKTVTKVLSVVYPIVFIHC